jgi:hypothetical protein
MRRFYLGDAVFAHFDGYGVELRLNHHESRCAVYLEPEVLQNLIEFWNSTQKRKDANGRETNPV